MSTEKSIEKAKAKEMKQAIKAARKQYPTASEDAVQMLARKMIELKARQLEQAINPAVEKEPPKVIKDYKNFKLIEAKGKLFISFQNYSAPHLWHYLQSHLRTIMGTGDFESCNKIFAVDYLAEIEARLRGELDDDDVDLDEAPFPDFFQVLRERSTALQEAMQKRLERGLVEATDLPMMFPKGSHIVFDLPEDSIGGILEDLKFKSSWSSAFWHFGIKILVNRKGIVEEVVREVKIPHWSGTKQLADLAPKVAQEGALFDALTARGRTFREISEGVSYVRCAGVLTHEKWYDTVRYRADGRVMVDPISYSMLDSNGHTEQVRSWGLRDMARYGRDEDVVGKKQIGYAITDNDLWRCHTHVLGFSFRAKKWGQMRVADISQIAFREDAFDHLVLDTDYKRTIRALVQNSGDSFSDVVEGKGGGCIFLLEGEPGQGKTLTAETVAEVLKRPLYPISVGELGTNADALENRLREILDVATRWKAVLLLDEADIFLEARDTNNIERNAMVGVFLRLLEYHEGVLFLTTNRCQNLDRAFLSRISVSISFPKANEAKRAAIWTQLLNASNMDHLIEHVGELVKYDVNGRQIKNTIRLAQTLASSEKRKTSLDDIVGTIRLNQDFADRLADAKAEADVASLPARTRRPSAAA